MFQFIPGIALSQVIESVKEKINSFVLSSIPVFMMKDLRCLNQKIL